MLKRREVLYKITMVSFLDKLHKNRDKPNFQEDLRNLVEEPIYSGSSFFVVLQFSFSFCMCWGREDV